VHELADAEEELRAARERERAPGRERLLRRLDGAVDLLGAREVDGSRLPTGGGVVDRAGAARLAGDGAAADPVRDTADTLLFLDGRQDRVPPGSGIDIAAPAVHRFPEPDGTVGYGGISPPCKHPCISPLHTHDPDGILHTESARAHPNRLGQFFTEWAVRLN